MIKISLGTGRCSTSASTRRCCPLPSGESVPWPEPDDGKETKPAGDGRSSLVQGRGHLSASRQVVLRLQQRWGRRLSRAVAEARLYPKPRRQRDLAATVLPVATPR